MSLSMSDKIFKTLNGIFLFTFVAAITYPLIFVASASISDPGAVATGKVWLWPVDLSFEGYQKVFENKAIWTGYKNTIIYTVVGVVLHWIFLLPCAYALSRQEMKGKTILTWFILFTMLFNGGMIPTYIIVKDLGMLDTIWSIVIPNVVGAWSILVAVTFFRQTIPQELVEASKIDGASDFTIFLKVALPLSAPIIAVMGLFHGVSLWNQYFKALIYLSNENMYPLQLILRQILIVSQAGAGDPQEMMNNVGEVESLGDRIKTAALIKYAVMIVAALPLLVAYPFLQRYFIQGVLIGSVKG